MTLTDLLIVAFMTGFSSLCSEYAKDLKRFIHSKIKLLMVRLKGEASS